MRLLKDALFAIVGGTIVAFAFIALALMIQRWVW